MKKIGICTLNEACNMGAILQAFALQETLKKMGYQPEFLKLKNCVIHDEGRITEEFLDMRKHLNISSKYYNPIEDKYDAIVIGSDEIWNVLEPSFEHIDEFLGYNLNAPKIIAYAPGANKADGNAFIKYYNGERNLSNFTSLSARDSHALDIIKKVAKVDAPILLDPTFLIDSYEPYMEECNEKDFILIYGWCFTDDEKQAIREFADSKGLKLYSVGYEYNSDWCDKFIGANIFKFISYIKKAQYAATSETFHGTIFSVIFNKQFVTTTHGRFKTRELVERLGLKDRDCSSAKEINEKLNEYLDYTNINKWIELEKNKSINYLKSAIEG